MKTRGRFFLAGGVKAAAAGNGTERFFNIAAQRELRISDIGEEENGAVSFWTTGEDYKKMKPVAKKAGVRLSIKKKYGLPFLIYRNRKRKLLFLGFFSFFFALYGLSFFIWDISFEGNYKFTDETLLHYMETIPVVFGMKKSEISCEGLEESIRNEFAEITWVSAEIRGTRLLIRVKENEALLSPVKADDTPCDLAAKKSGIITRCVVRSGFCQVKEGDQVAAGDLLVDGTIPIYDDSETLVNSHEIHADAEIYAKTEYQTEKSFPLTRQVKARTGKVRKGIFFRCFDRSFYFLMPASGQSSWEFVMEEAQLEIFENYCLPVYGGIITAWEYMPYEKTYTREEISAAGQKHLGEYAEKLSEKGIQILANNGRIEKDESGWKYQGTLHVIENIAGEVPIPESFVQNEAALGDSIPEKQEEIQTGNELD